MSISSATLGAAKKYVKESLLGGGSIVGKNVVISSITPINNGNRITFSYTLDDGTAKTSTVDVMNGKDGSDGVGITNIEKTSTVGLIDTYKITFTNNSTYNFTVTNGRDGSGTDLNNIEIIQGIL